MIRSKPADAMEACDTYVTTSHQVTTSSMTLDRILYLYFVTGSGQIEKTYDSDYSWVLLWTCWGRNSDLPQPSPTLSPTLPDPPLDPHTLSPFCLSFTLMASLYCTAVLVNTVFFSGGLCGPSEQYCSTCRQRLMCTHSVQWRGLPCDEGSTVCVNNITMTWCM